MAQLIFMESCEGLKNGEDVIKMKKTLHKQMEKQKIARFVVVVVVVVVAVLVVLVTCCPLRRSPQKPI